MKNALQKLAVVASLAVLSLVWAGQAPPLLAQTLSPSSLTFPAGLVGTAEATMTTTFTNSISSSYVNPPAAPVTISSITVTVGGTNSGDFSVSTSPSTNCGSSLTAGSTCTLTVTFTPGAVGPRSATVTIAWTGNALSPITLYLFGSGYTQAQIDVPAENCFAAVGTGTIGSQGESIAAASNPVWQLTAGSSGNGTFNVTCVLPQGLFHTQAGTTLTVQNVDVYYGAQGSALTAAAAPTINSVTYPATGGTAAGTVATTVGGSLTVSPGTLQLSTTTTGRCYHEDVALGTPYAAVDGVQLNITQQFTLANSAVLQVCKLTVYGTWQ